jgi:hypothetical protein
LTCIGRHTWPMSEATLRADRGSIDAWADRQIGAQELVKRDCLERLGSPVQWPWSARMYDKT